jgi:hypothetical protein
MPLPDSSAQKRTLSKPNIIYHYLLDGMKFQLVTR